MSRRSLTRGEITLAQSIFSDSIDYASVGVYDRGYAFLNAMGNMSYRGNIYLPDDHYADFSDAPLRHKRLFIHESVHVWQHQNNILNLAVAALREGVKHRFNYGQAYLFHLEMGKDLLDYGLEQQAAIIEDYFLRQHGGPSMGRCLNTETNTQTLLEGVLTNFLNDPAYARRRRRLPRLARPMKPISVWAPAAAEPTDINCAV